ncbi:MAG: hypothetical protein R3305_09645 [Gammaproteobacteria bacterium]|nr:hypothetical protein [Gammaproteobacteria bacterium]
MSGRLRTLRPILAALAATGLAMTLGACSGDKEIRCSTNLAYRSADSMPPLRVPEDLDIPDERNALQIPEPLAPLQPEDECLELSPAFGEEV